MRRPQFILKTLLWLMAMVAAFLGGMAVGAYREHKEMDDALEFERATVRNLSKTIGELDDMLKERGVQAFPE